MPEAPPELDDLKRLLIPGAPEVVMVLTTIYEFDMTRALEEMPDSRGQVFWAAPAAVNA